MRVGDCVKVPGGRIGRVRDIRQDTVRVRLMRTTSHTHQFVWYTKSHLQVVACPNGWMSSERYNRYLEITLKKMKQRNTTNGEELPELQSDEDHG